MRELLELALGTWREGDLSATLMLTSNKEGVYFLDLEPHLSEHDLGGGNLRSWLREGVRERNAQELVYYSVRSGRVEIVGETPDRVQAYRVPLEVAPILDSVEHLQTFWVKTGDIKPLYLFGVMA